MACIGDTQTDMTNYPRELGKLLNAGREAGAKNERGGRSLRDVRPALHFWLLTSCFWLFARPQIRNTPRGLWGSVAPLVLGCEERALARSKRDTRLLGTTR